MLLYYITDRKQFPGDAAEKERRVLAKIAECAAAGVDYIQLREKDLGARELEALATKASRCIPAVSRTRLLVNSRCDVALACGAHGVHLPAGDLAPGDARGIFVRAGAANAVIGVSTHSLEEVAAADEQGASFIVFGPVFEKSGQANPHGLEQLRQACHRPRTEASPVPVLALGGITLENARVCLDAGAAGIAAIRLFQENPAAEIASRVQTIAKLSR
ncbi:MAG: thiamine phosphate synthase [Acidobacteriia bacterium]|nr:thiamine phosphate synthase [Terriglobia bacterium]